VRRWKWGAVRAAGGCVKSGVDGCTGDVHIAAVASGALQPRGQRCSPLCFSRMLCSAPARCRASDASGGERPYPPHPLQRVVNNKVIVVSPSALFSAPRSSECGYEPCLILVEDLDGTAAFCRVHQSKHIFARRQDCSRDTQRLPQRNIDSVRTLIRPGTR
jgi:hypothetical protein